MSINEIIPSDAFILQVIGIGALILIAVLAYGYRVELLSVGRAFFLRYVTVPTLADIADDRVFPHSHQEAEAEAPRKLEPGSDGAMLVITHDEYQTKLAAERETGMIEMFAIIEQRGYLAKGKATEIKAAAFQVGGGRALQRLNKAIDAVAVPAEPQPSAAPAEATAEAEAQPVQLKPVSGLPRNAERYSGEPVAD